MSARCKGWRIFTPDSARAALPNSTIRRVSATFAESVASIADFLAMGKSARCTECGAFSSTGAINSCQTCSVINGTMGASSKVSVRSASCNVANALGSPSQKRRRERLTYQFDRSSINVASVLPARCVSNSLNEVSTSLMRTFRSEMIQRSMSGRSERGRAVLISKSAAFA